VTTACKSKPKHREAPANPSTPTGTAGGSAGQPAPDLQLPHSAGGPPKKTTAPLAKADFERLAQLNYPGFERQVRTVSDKVLEVRQITTDHPRLWATITIQPCLDCVPMELDKWRSKLDDLRVLLGPLKDAPGVTFEVGAVALAGQPIIYTYQLGNSNGVDGDSKIPVMSEPNAAYSIIDRQGEKTAPTIIVKRVEAGKEQYTKRAIDCNAKTWKLLAGAATVAELAKAQLGSGAPAQPAAQTADEAILVQACKAATGPGLNYSFTNALALYYNDGVNQIRVVAEYKDDPMSVEGLQQAAPKDDLAKLALSFLDVYTHAW
jgi:hypothetical protein